MGVARCSICNRGFSKDQKIVRVLAELVSCDQKNDGKDADFWSNVEEWDSLTTMHLACVQRSISEDKEIPYGDEIGVLPLFDDATCTFKDDGTVPPALQLVEGGAS